MITNFFKQLFFIPLYNALVLIINLIPGHNIPLAIIVLTLVVKFILLPLQHRLSKTQKKIKLIDGDLKQIKEKYKDNNQEQTRRIMELYQTHGINPLSGFIVLLIQIPVIFALYYVFNGGFDFQPDLLYSFVAKPLVTTTTLWGRLNISEQSWPLALVVGLSQFIQIRLLMPASAPPQKSTGQATSWRQDFASSMNLQMRYVMPVILIFIAAKLPAALSLYWITSNIFSIGHEWLVRRQAN